MEIYTNIFDWTAPDAGCAIALGRFDGVHLGHRALLERAVEHAGIHELEPVCFSFQENTYPGAHERGQLTTSEEKSEILESIGVKVLLHPEFKKPLIDMTAENFLTDLLVNRWHARLVVVGFDCHFGRGREGDTEFLRQEGKQLGMEVEIFPPFEIDGIPVKATNIRNLIKKGSIRKANSLLGRPYSIRARNRGGRQFGRSIGFPTLNFAFPEEKVKPKRGVYAVRMHTDELDIPVKDNRIGFGGVANYGVRPTVEPENTEALLEVHILENDNGGDLTDKIPPDTLFEIEFIEFIREERKFDSIDELKIQISEDCEAAKNISGIHRADST